MAINNASGSSKSIECIFSSSRTPGTNKEMTLIRNQQQYPDQRFRNLNPINHEQHGFPTKIKTNSEQFKSGITSTSTGICSH